VNDASVEAVLQCPTPSAWLSAVADNLQTLLIDHANCERKAALTALGLIHRYPRQRDLVQQMSRLAREELRHFEQVLDLMAERGYDYQPLNASRYAKTLLKTVSSDEPARLLDALLVGALIEARSCERFRLLASHPGLDAQLVGFYSRLEESERRHFRNYLVLAEQVAGASTMTARLAPLADLEAQLIVMPDDEFRFHSGPPSMADGLTS
jgi:tRNA-(ms[2]io[6]A)-hydroxylase